MNRPICNFFLIARIAVIVILIYGNCVFNTENYNKIFIDKEIQKAVGNEIIDTFQANKNNCELHYMMNNIYLDFYSNDSLQIFNIGPDKHRPFWSYWGEIGDTVIIYGFFGGGGQGRYGFEIDIIDKKTEVYLSLSTHAMAQFSYTKEGIVEWTVKVPTEISKVTLSKMPDMEHPETIFGYVEFESKDFFQITKYENGEEVPNQRDRVNSNMRIYFKANRCDSLERM